MSKAERPQAGDVFFMKQKIRNVSLYFQDLLRLSHFQACGTFALFNALANLEGVVDLGSGPFYQWLQTAKLADEESRSELLEKGINHKIYS